MDSPGAVTCVLKNQKMEVKAGESQSMKETQLLLALKTEEGATSQGMQNRRPLKSGYGLQLTASKKIGISILQPLETELRQYPE